MSDVVELIAGALFTCPDPVIAASRLAEILVGNAQFDREARAFGLDPILLAALKRSLPALDSTRATCLEAAAWVRGYRAANRTDLWELVATLPTGAALPSGLRRTTGETLVALISRAKQTVRLVAPFFDGAGIQYVGGALAAATLRRVVIEIFEPERSWAGAEALAGLELLLKDRGDVSALKRVRVVAKGPWAHLKVVVIDGTEAYIGSANFTGPGLGGRNLELGVLVKGESVKSIGNLLDTYREAVP